MSAAAACADRLGERAPFWHLGQLHGNVVQGLGGQGGHVRLQGRRGGASCRRLFQPPLLLQALALYGSDSRPATDSRPAMPATTGDSRKEAACPAADIRGLAATAAEPPRRRRVTCRLRQAEAGRGAVSSAGLVQAFWAPHGMAMRGGSGPCRAAGAPNRLRLKP